MYLPDGCWRNPQDGEGLRVQRMAIERKDKRAAQAQAAAQPGEGLATNAPGRSEVNDPDAQVLQVRRFGPGSGRVPAFVHHHFGNLLDR
ncbi:hypothetical protein [Hymenobacter properus]|uniref:Uncharacterized protein n=1 Tax=Hymenobacter properus TaxID=2791026 RepID=A0A931BG10_9BACT|nr:hypothetical protein [Hymenobacter properus]MBF9143244.1 hypothetical protein [Hymenobacter properus]MBR7722054.1 hypothetical protein [Microvirga sp. SRT04]